MFILDLIIIAIFLICVIMAVKRGFIKSLFGMLAGLSAFFIALVLSTPFGNYLNRVFISPYFKKSVTEKLLQMLGEGVGASESAAVVEGSQSIQKYIQSFGVSVDEVKNKILNSPSVEQGRQAAAETIYESFASTIGKILAFFILFIAIILLCKFLSSALSAVFKLPVLSQINGLLGGAMGAVKAVIYIVVFVTATTAVFPKLQANNIFGMKDATLEETVLFKTVQDINPLGFLVD